MLFLKYLLMVGAIGLFAVAATLIGSMVYSEVRKRLRPEPGPDEPGRAPDGSKIRMAAALGFAGFLCMLIALSIVVIPSGMAGVTVSQISGALPGTLYPGVHLILPLIEHVELYDVREKLFSTTAALEKSASPKLLAV